jgi:hypothetical protein
MTHAFKGILLMEMDTGAQTITPVLPICDRPRALSDARDPSRGRRRYRDVTLTGSKMDALGAG